MKICFIADGASRHLENWVNYLKKQNEIIIISHRRSKLEGVKNYVLFSNQNNKKEVYRESGRLKKLLKMVLLWPYAIYAIKKINPDVIYGFGLFPYGVITVYSGSKIPTIISPLGSDILILPKKYKVFKYFAKKCLKKANLIQVDSQQMKSVALDLGCLKEKCVYLCLPGVNLKTYDRPSKKIPFSILCTRLWEPVYDMPTTIRAFASIAKAEPRARLYLLGGGPLEKELKDLAKDLNVFDKIKWIGWVPRQKSIDYMKKCEVLVSSSLSDSTCVSLLEAMACGLPAVITNLKVNEEWIKNGWNGFLFPTKDYKKMSENILKLFNNNDLRNKFRKRNKDIIEKRANYLIEMKKLEQHLKQLSRQE